MNASMLTPMDLQTVITALTLAGILWLLKTSSDNKSSLRVLQSTIDSNIIPEIKRLREAGHVVRELVQGVRLDVELVSQRVETIESWNGEERRHGSADRRVDPHGV